MARLIDLETLDLVKGAGAGILRRATRRGKTLPERLEQALRALAGTATTSTAAEPS